MKVVFDFLNFVAHLTNYRTLRRLMVTLIICIFSITIARLVVILVPEFGMSSANKQVLNSFWMLGSVIGVVWTFVLLLAKHRFFLQRNSSLASPSGSGLLKFCRFLLPKAVSERIVEDAINDMRDQQYEAMANGEIWHARWIGVRDQMRILLALGLEPISKAILSIIAPFIPKK